MVFMIASHLQSMPCEGYYLTWVNTFSPTVTTQIWHGPYVSSPITSSWSCGFADPSMEVVVTSSRKLSLKLPPSTQIWMKTPLMVMVMPHVLYLFQQYPVFPCVQAFLNQGHCFLAFPIAPWTPWGQRMAFLHREQDIMAPSKVCEISELRI